MIRRLWLPGHGKELILTPSKMKSYRKVLLRINVIRFMDFVTVVLNHSGR